MNVDSSAQSSRQQQQQQQATRLLGVEEAISRYHRKHFGLGQCGSMHMQRIAASVADVWTLVRRFERPQSYKRFIRSCRLASGNGGVGSVREVTVVSGLPAEASTERLECLDDERCVLNFAIIGGDHRLKNYRSTTTVHEGEQGKRAVVVESYVVDVPEGSTAEETCIFADTIVRCNLQSLAEVTERAATRGGGGAS